MSEPKILHLVLEHFPTERTSTEGLSNECDYDIVYVGLLPNSVGSKQRGHWHTKCHVFWMSRTRWWEPSCGVVYLVLTSSPLKQGSISR